MALSVGNTEERAASQDAGGLATAGEAPLEEAAAGGDGAEQAAAAAQGGAGASGLAGMAQWPAAASLRRTSSAARSPAATTTAAIAAPRAPCNQRLRGELRGGVNQNLVLRYDEDGPNHNRPAPGELDHLQHDGGSDRELEQFPGQGCLQGLAG